MTNYIDKTETNLKGESNFLLPVYLIFNETNHSLVWLGIFDI